MSAELGNLRIAITGALVYGEELTHPYSDQYFEILLGGPAHLSSKLYALTHSVLCSIAFARTTNGWKWDSFSFLAPCSIP